MTDSINLAGAHKMFQQRGLLNSGTQTDSISQTGSKLDLMIID